MHLGAVRLLLIVTCSLFHTSIGAKPRENLAQPDFSLYHSLSVTLDEVERIAAACPTVMKVEEQSLELSGYNTTMKIVTVEPGGFTDEHSNKARLLINFGEHGRELISPEIALRLLEALCDPSKLSYAIQGLSESDTEALLPVLQRSVLKIVPMENPNGRLKVENGDLCERKNGRGVDPNRNWSVHWGHKEPDYDPKEEFPGTAPFSEPEAALLRALAEEFKPHVWLNVHSGMEAMFVPYDHKNEVPQGTSADATLSILHKLNEAMCGGRCAVGPGGKTVGYLAHGTATDYMHDELNVGLVMTWEVYGDNNASFHDCFRMFNPLEKQEYEDVVSRWTAGVLGLIAALPGHPSVPELMDLAVVETEGATVASRDGEVKVDGGMGSESSDAAASKEKKALGRKGGASIVDPTVKVDTTTADQPADDDIEEDGHGSQQQKEDGDDGGGGGGGGEEDESAEATAGDADGRDGDVVVDQLDENDVWWEVIEVESEDEGVGLSSKLAGRWVLDWTLGGGGGVYGAGAAALLNVSVVAIVVSVVGVGAMRLNTSAGVLRVLRSLSGRRRRQVPV